MHALVATHFGSPPQMRIELRDKPTAKDGFTLVRMHAATVNPLSHQVRLGMTPQSHAPLVLSNDGSGVVEQSGRFAVGTRVAIHGGAQLGITQDGLQQQWVSVEDKRIIVLPDGVDLDQGAALAINYLTAHQALTRVGRVAQGQTVLISGASGAVGLALVQTACALGASPIAVVSSPEKAARATQAGAMQVIDLSSQDLKEAVLSATKGQGADLACDPVGGALLGQLLGALRPRGAVVSIGFVGGVTATLDVADVVVHEKRVLGYDAWLETDADIAAAFDFIGQGLTEGRLRPMIDSVFPLGQFEAAYARLASRQAAGAILLNMHSTS